MSGLLYKTPESPSLWSHPTDLSSHPPPWALSNSQLQLTPTYPYLKPLPWIQTPETKNKSTDQLDYINIKGICMAKRCSKQKWKKSWWGKNCNSSQRLTQLIIKELSKISCRNHHPVVKWAKKTNELFTRKEKDAQLHSWNKCKCKLDSPIVLKEGQMVWATLF